MDRGIRLAVNGEIVFQATADVSGAFDFQLASFLSRVGRPIRNTDDVRFSILPPVISETPGLPGVEQWRAELLVTEALPFETAGKIAVVRYGLANAVPDAQIRVVQFGPWVAKEGDAI